MKKSSEFRSFLKFHVFPLAIETRLSASCALFIRIQTGVCRMSEAKFVIYILLCGMQRTEEKEQNHVPNDFKMEQ